MEPTLENKHSFRNNESDFADVGRHKCSLQTLNVFSEFKHKNPGK